MSNTYPASGIACIQGIYSNTRLGGFPGGGDGALFMCIPGNDYHAIRSFDSCANTNTIHFFGTTWGGGAGSLETSSGTINLDGSCGVTLGPWHAPQMVLKRSNGDVGIGTANPSFRLHVESGSPRIYIRGTSGDAGIFMKASSSTAGWTVKDNGSNEFTIFSDSANSHRLYINSTGNVGLGTTSPSSRLDVSGADGRIQSRVDSSDGSTINIRPNAGKCGWISYTEDAVADRWGIGIKNGDGALYFASGNVGVGGGTTRMVLTSTGAIGLGTASPASRLHINHTSAEGACTIILQSTNSCGNGTISWRSSGGVTQAQIGANYNVSDPAGNLELITSGATRLLVTSAGRIGMGVTAPNHTLTVNGNVGVVGYNWRLQSDSDGNWGFGLCNSNTTYYTYLSYAPDVTSDRRGGIFSIAGNQWIAYGDCRANFLVTTCVGIGTITPSYRLHVNGTFYAAGSSIKYKESICNYNTDSCLFMCLKPVTYQYKDEFKHLGKELKSETQIGLIAEDVAESHPELAILVNEEDNKVVRNVDYEKLSIILLSELQKLRKEVDELKQ